MIAIPDKNFFTPQDYLDWEAQQPVKYEYVDGDVYAMTGGTLPHTDIALNFATNLRNRLREKGCKAFMSDAKVGITEQGPFFYPDVAVTCHPSDLAAIDYLRHPCLIAEVLSPSTEAYDRGGKFAHYRQLESLKEYLLISAEEVAIDVFRLNERGKWELTPYIAGDEIELTSFNLTIPIAALYEDVVLASLQTEQAS